VKKRALISVSDKTGIVELARSWNSFPLKLFLREAQQSILTEAGIPVINVSEVTDFPECLDGRVKTLHPKYMEEFWLSGIIRIIWNSWKELGIDTIDLVVINLYPFRQTILKEDVKLEEAIENIDIGGPAMLRAAAKNYQGCCCGCGPCRLFLVLEELKKGEVSQDTKFYLAAKVFEHDSPL
jgi:phosphoribosylaminoimidazolecarboxamide formyltransferase/IMP cyclohydrolase